MATTDTLATQITTYQADLKARADSALAAAATALTNADAAANSVSLGAPGLIFGTAPVVAPIADPTLPQVDFGNEVKNAFDYAFGQMNQALAPQIMNFLGTFFPDIAQAVKTNSDNWIANTILNGQFVPVAVENAIWNRERERETQLAAKQVDEAASTFAARGFSMPPGYLADAVLTAQQESNKKLASISRDVAIKSFDVANENTKFAITEAVKLRTAFIGAMGDFIKLAQAAPNSAVEYSRTMMDAKAKLFSLMMQLYEGQISEARLRSDVDVAKMNAAVHEAGQLVDRYRAETGNAIEVARLKATTAMSAAQTLATVAASAMQSNNTMLTAAGSV